MSRQSDGGPAVLVVEDNPVTLKLMRVVLAARGYRVLEAADAREALALAACERPVAVVQDMLLPDMDGRELALRLRDAFGSRPVPIVACSGLHRDMPTGELQACGFAAFLLKPVAPELLLDTLERLAPVPAPTVTDVAAEHDVLLVDDDPTALQVVRALLEGAGFRVGTARDGAGAVDAALRRPPRAIVAAVVLAGMDGFELCLRVRSEPRLAAVPVVLHAHVVSEQDRELGRQVGATEVVQRGADADELLAAVRWAVTTPSAPPPTVAALPDHGRLRRLIRQMERRIAAVAAMERRWAGQSAALTLLGGLAEVVMRHGDFGAALVEQLGRCLAAVDLSRGALYLCEDGFLTPRAQVGFADLSALSGCFGACALFDAVIAGGHPRVVTGDEADEEERSLLDATASTSCLLVPLHQGWERLGLLALLSRRPTFDEGLVDWGRTMAMQFAMGVALARSQERLSVSERRLRLLLDSTGEAIVGVDREGRVAFHNATAAHLLGWVEDSQGRDLHDLIHHSRADGSPHPRQECPLWATCHGGGGQALARETVWRADGVPIQVDLSVWPILEGGRPTGAVVTMLDAGERVALERQLYHSQKMEAMGLLAGGVAHDFNNLLTAVTGYAELAQNETAASDPRHAYLAEVLAASERASALTRQLLLFCRGQVSQPRRVEVAAAMAALEKMLRRIIGEDVLLEVAAQGAPLYVHIDPGHLEQVVVNLSVNARDAMPGGGHLDITAAGVVVGPGSADLKPGAYVRIDVADSGCGMDTATMGHIFEPFFTTKEAGKGSGLGLSTVYGIVRQAGGAVQVESSPGAGTTFSVLLPAVDAAPDEASSPAASSPAMHGWETILLVEDDDRIRSFLGQALERSGYRVLRARGGAEALHLAREHAGTVHLLLTDVVMPGASGPDLARDLLATRPDLRVLYMSGYVDERVRLQAGPAETTRFLQKPFRTRDALRAVREALDA